MDIYWKRCKEYLIEKWWIIILILAFILIPFSFIFVLNEKIKLEWLAQYWDAFWGIIWSLFALISVFLLFITLRFQRKEFEDQRKEIEITRVFNIIYKQSEIVEQKINKLHFKSYGKYKTEIRGYWVLKSQIIFSDSDNMDKDTFFRTYALFITNTDTKWHILTLENSLKLCIKVIDTLEGPSRSQALDILKTNFYLNETRIYLNNLKRIHNKNLERPIADNISYETQEIKRIEKMLILINSTLNHQE